MEELKQMIRVGFAEIHEDIAKLNQRMDGIERDLKDLRYEVKAGFIANKAVWKEHEIRIEDLETA